MSRTPARFTEADLNRAAKVAKARGFCVRVTKAGDIILEPHVAQDEPPKPALDTGLDTGREIHM